RRGGLLAFALILLLLPTLAPAPAEACGGKAVPSGCGRTVVLTTGVPSTLLSTGGAFDLDVEVYFALANFAGPPACPPAPFELDLEFTVTCAPAGDGGGSLLDVPIGLGYNSYTVGITLPAGPPRLCSVAGEATVTFGDASTVTATNGAARLCLVDPAPAAPSLPRLHLELVDPTGALARAHPGDATSHVLRLTNRDDTSSFEGGLEIRSVNVSKVPGSTGILTPGDGVFSPADPGDGDNFPLAFGDGGLACVPLPPEPQLPVVPLLEQDILLGPGESTEVEVLTRSWGMCADGSCSQSTALIDGTFTDLTSGLACASFATLTDLTVPPSFLWPDTGASVIFDPPGDPFAGVIP
ncbi:MAG: hypothetical protein MI919_22600, partial [Holophagales bacterium]|nr:hypothetical protein [Holophagales bacterium]